MFGRHPIVHRLARLALAKAYIALTRVMVDSVFGKKPADHSLLLIGSAISVHFHRRAQAIRTLAICSD